MSEITPIMPQQPQQRQLSPAEIEKREKQTIIDANVELFFTEGKQASSDESVGGNAGHKELFGYNLACSASNFFSDEDGMILMFGNYQFIPKRIRAMGIESTWHRGFQFPINVNMMSTFIIGEYNSKHLTPKGVEILRETVKTINVRVSRSWEALEFAIQLNGDITTSNNDIYKPEFLIKLIERVKNGHPDEVDTIPRANGLRKKVIELLKAEETIKNIPSPLAIKK